MLLLNNAYSIKTPAKNDTHEKKQDFFKESIKPPVTILFLPGNPVRGVYCGDN
jgi:hypothetical protein